MEPDEDQHYFVRLTFLLRWNLGFRGKLVLLITPTLDINPWLEMKNENETADLVQRDMYLE